MEQEQEKGPFQFQGAWEGKNFQQMHQERLRRKRERWERHVQKRTQNCQNMKHSRKGWLGVGIILVGVVWLLNVMGVVMPAWLFSWPMLLVTLGVFSGLASGFRNMASFVFIFVGLVFIARNYFLPDIPLDHYVWPVVLIFVGILFLVKRHNWEERREWGKQWMEAHQRKWSEFGRDGWKPGAVPAGAPAADEPTPGTAPAEAVPAGREKWGDSEDWLDVTTIFGGAKRHVISKNFKGGDLTNLCGGTVIDLTHADIQGTAVIDLVAIWGGIKLAVPPNWQVRLNLTHLMAGTDDRRMNKAVVPDPNKVLVVTGTVLMAGIEIADRP